MPTAFPSPRRTFSRWFNPDDPIYYCMQRVATGFRRCCVPCPSTGSGSRTSWCRGCSSSIVHSAWEHSRRAACRLLHSPGHDDQLDDFHIVKSSDTTLYSDNILDTLIAWCRANRVEFVTNASVKLSATMTRGSTIVTINGEQERFDTVFLAAGAGNGPLLRDLAFDHPGIGLTMVERTLRRSTHGQETPHLRAQRLHDLSHSAHAPVQAGRSDARARR